MLNSIYTDYCLVCFSGIFPNLKDNYSIFQCRLFSKISIQILFEFFSIMELQTILVMLLQVFGNME